MENWGVRPTQERYWTKKELERKNDWNHLDFLNYLNIVSIPGITVALRTGEHPHSFQPGNRFHHIFDSLREKTESDYQERYLVFGFSSKSRASQLIFTSESRGETHKITEDIINKQHRAAYQNNIRYLVGSIHTHPNIDIMPRQGDVVTESFSPSDLYLVARGNFDKENRVMFVVGPTHNLAVFRSKETYTHPIPHVVDQKKFKKHFNQKHRLRLSKSETVVDFVLNRNLPDPDFYYRAIEMNLDIAKKYHLVMYAGLPGNEMKRINDKWKG